MKTKPKIMIFIRGGIVQGAVSNTDTDLIICDYDTEGNFEEDSTDEPELVNVYREKPLTIKQTFSEYVLEDNYRKEQALQTSRKLKKLKL